MPAIIAAAELDTLGRGRTAPRAGYSEFFGEHLMPKRQFGSIKGATAWLMSPDFAYPVKVSTVAGGKGVVVFRLSKAESSRYLPLSRRLRNKSIKDALFSVVKDSGTDAASTFYNIKKGNWFGAAKSAVAMFKGFATLPDEQAWEERLAEREPELYEVHQLQESFRKLALFSYLHVKNVIGYAQNGPVYAGEFYDGTHQIFYLKLSR
jgi:hypothetical protein